MPRLRTIVEFLSSSLTQLINLYSSSGIRVKERYYLIGPKRQIELMGKFCQKRQFSFFFLYAYRSIEVDFLFTSSLKFYRDNGGCPCLEATWLYFLPRKLILLFNINILILAVMVLLMVLAVLAV